MGNIINDILKNKQNQNIKKKEINEKIENKSKTTINNSIIINNLNYKDIFKNKVPNFLSFNNTNHSHNLTLEDIISIINNYTYQIIISLYNVTLNLKKIRKFKEENTIIFSNDNIILIENYLKQSLYNNIWLRMIDIHDLFKYINNNVLKKMIKYLIILHSDENSPKERLDNMVNELEIIEQKSFKFIHLFEANIMTIFHNCYQILMNILKNDKEIANLIPKISQN